MGPQKHLTVQLEPEEKRRLEQLAREFNILQSRGAGANRLGNISGLLSAIARGEILLLRPEEGEAATREPDDGP